MQSGRLIKLHQCTNRPTYLHVVDVHQGRLPSRGHVGQHLDQVPPGPKAGTAVGHDELLWGGGAGEVEEEGDKLFITHTHTPEMTTCLAVRSSKTARITSPFCCSIYYK